MVAGTGALIAAPVLGAREAPFSNVRNSRVAVALIESPFTSQSPLN